MEIKDLTNKVILQLSDDLLDPTRRTASGRHRLFGHCYVATETLYHLLGGKKGQWKPKNIRHEGDSHWYLENKITGEILDATVDQFNTIPDYSQGRGRGFLTSQPSKRSLELLTRVREIHGKLIPRTSEKAREALKGFERA